MAFDATDYVSGLSMGELNDLLYYGANLPTGEQRIAARDAAQARLSQLYAEYDQQAAQGGAGGSGGLVEGDAGGTWNGVYPDGSTISGGGYGGVEGRGTNNIPYEGVTIADVDSIYQDVLGREADSAGRDYWINSGMTADEIRNSIMQSEEYQANQASRSSDINAIYQDLLGRDADGPGLDYWENSGMTLDQIRDSITQSQEYQTAQALRDQETAAPDDPFVAPGYEGTDTYPGQADFDANAYVSDLSIAELNNILFYGANLPTADQRRAANAAAQARLSELYADTEPSYGGAGGSGGLIEGEAGGTWDGIYIDGSSPTGGGYGGDEGRGTNEIPLPDGINPLPGGPGVQDPTHPGATDWGGANLGQDGGSVVDGVYVPPPSGNGGGDMSNDDDYWNDSIVGGGAGGGTGGGTGGGAGGGGAGGDGRDPFVPQGPGYIDSFLPGSRNDPFYTDQFNRLAAQNYDFQNQQALAREMRENAEPSTGMPDDPWAWVEGGLPDVTVSDGFTPAVGQEPSWGLNEALGVSSGMTNFELTNALMPQFSQKSQDVWRQHWANPDTNREGTFWTGAGSPDAVRDAWFGQENAPKGSFRDAINEMLDLAYVNQTTAYGGDNVPVVAPGYAQPVSSWSK